MHFGQIGHVIRTLSLVIKTDSGTPNNTLLNNFDIFNKVFKNQFERKNFEIKKLIGYFKLMVKNKFLLLL